MEPPLEQKAPEAPGPVKQSMVPEPTILKDTRALLEQGKCSDVRFMMQDEVSETYPAVRQSGGTRSVSQASSSGPMRAEVSISLAPIAGSVPWQAKAPTLMVEKGRAAAAHEETVLDRFMAPWVVMGRDIYALSRGDATKTGVFSYSVTSPDTLKTHRVAFLAPSTNAVQTVAAPKQASQPAGQQSGASFGVKMAAVASGAAAAVGLASSRRRSKTAARYTTQTILPSLAWIKTGVKASELQPKQLKALTLAGNDVLIGKTEAGALFCVGNLCPHIGTPMSEGADVIGDVIVCPLHGSSFKVTTGELLDWCVSPPVIGPLTGLIPFSQLGNMIVEKKNLLVFEVRQGGLLGTGDVEAFGFQDPAGLKWHSRCCDGEEDGDSVGAPLIAGGMPAVDPGLVLASANLGPFTGTTYTLSVLATSVLTMSVPALLQRHPEVRRRKGFRAAAAAAATAAVGQIAFMALSLTPSIAFANMLPGVTVSDFMQPMQNPFMVVHLIGHSLNLPLMNLTLGRLAGRSVADSWPEIIQEAYFRWPLLILGGLCLKKGLADLEEVSKFVETLAPRNPTTQVWTQKHKICVGLFVCQASLYPTIQSLGYMDVLSMASVQSIWTLMDVFLTSGIANMQLALKESAHVVKSEEFMARKERVEHLHEVVDSTVDAHARR
eukprot:s571_g13.t1